MTVGEVSGLIIAASGAALLPIGYYADRRLSLLAGIVIAIGLLILITPRVARRLSKDDPDDEITRYSGGAGTSKGDPLAQSRSNGHAGAFSDDLGHDADD